MGGTPSFSEPLEDSYTDLYTLGEIVVTAERGGVESTTTVREISAAEIETRGARTLDEALELLPGVNIRVGAQGIPRVDFRGFRSRHVILLLDGIPLNSTFDGQFDPSLIPVENIAKIKVTYGTHSLLYGDGGLGGVINIVTKKGKEGLHGSILGEGGEGDRYLGQFTFSGAKDKFDYFFSGSYFDQRAYPLSNDFHSTSEEDGDLRENSDKERRNLFANVGYRPHDDWNLGVVLSYLTGEFGQPPSTINDRDDIFANRPNYRRVDDFEGLSGHFSAEFDDPGPLNVRSWVFFNYLEEENNRYDDENYNSMDSRNSSSFDDETFIKGAAVQTRYDFGDYGLLSLALNARQEEYTTDGKTQTGSGFEDFRDSNDIEIYTAALEYEVSPLENLLLVLGYGHNWFDNDRGDDDNDSSFLVGASYDLFENTRLRGSAARQIRFPAIRQLYDTDGGNPDLTAERSYNYEAGFDQRLPYKTTVSFTGFYIDVKDYIEKLLVDGTEQFLNNDDYEFTGFEISGVNRIIENLMVRVGYTYMETEDKSSGAERDELQNRPTHKITVEGQYDFDFGLTAYLSVSRIADQVFYSRQTPLQQKKGDDFTLVGCKLDQAFFDGMLHAYVGVDNLFDENFEESYGFPGEGRFIYAGGKLIF
jgi:outer membrane cobalamin receptor